jgi:hypothetical protein
VFVIWLEKNTSGFRKFGERRGAWLGCCAPLDRFATSVSEFIQLASYGMDGMNPLLVLAAALPKISSLSVSLVFTTAAGLGRLAGR